MKRYLDIWAGGESLRNRNSLILIQGITEEDNESDLNALAMAGRHGQFLADIPRRRCKTVTVTFAVRELYDLAARARAVDDVNAWARDGWIMISSRPEQRLLAVCSKRATAGAVRDYTQEMTVAFSAYSRPFWEDVTPSVADFEAEGELYVPGSQESVGEITVTAGEALEGVSINMGGRVISFPEIEMASGDELVIDHDEDGFFRARLEGVTVLSERSASSDDDFYVSPGLVPVTVTAGGAVTCRASCYGRWA